MDTVTTKEELKLAIDEAEWGWLYAHLGRGGLILVDDSIDLSHAAAEIARDNANIVNSWINDGKIGKPTETQVNTWNDNKHKKFSMLIVSPYVLIQERLQTFH